MLLILADGCQTDDRNSSALGQNEVAIIDLLAVLKVVFFQ